MDLLRLHSGTEVEIRPVRPDDGPRLTDAYGRLSPESRYRRFMSAKPYLNQTELKYLVEVDPADHIALAATPADQPERIIGVARLIRLPDDPLAGEFAIVVADEWQGEGLAGELLDRLVAAAPSHRIERLRATMLADNLAIRRLLASLGEPQAVRTRGSTRELEFDLAA